MVRLVVLLLFIGLVASFPFVNDWLSKNKSGIGHDEVYINNLIKGYVDNHPDHIMSSLRKYSVMQEEESRKSFINSAVLEHKAELYDNNYPTIGNGDIRIVEFFDYACSYCKTISAFVEDLIKTQGDSVQYTFRELAMFSPGSEIVGKAALAVKMISPDKHFDFYKAAISFKETYTEDSVRKLVQGIGVDMVAFEEAWKSEEVTSMLSGSFELFQKLGLNGTPAFIVCDNPVIGANIEGVKKAINECKNNTAQ